MKNNPELAVRHSSKLNRKEPIVYLFYVIVTLVVIVCFIPFWMIVIGSLTDEQEVIEQGYSLWPQHFSLEAYKMVFQVPVKIIDAYKVSILITVVGTFVSLFFSSMAAFVLMRNRLQHRLSSRLVDGRREPVSGAAERQPQARSAQPERHRRVSRLCGFLPEHHAAERNPAPCSQTE